MDATGVDKSFRIILTEIYRLMSRKTIAPDQDTRGSGVGAGKGISSGVKVPVDVKNEGAPRKSGCC